MASQLRFEGPVLEDLLDRVRADVGPGARIVAANRIRKGGLGGFFSKEHFEVLVEKTNGSAPASAPASAPTAAPAVARPTSTPAGPGRARVPTTILDLAEAINDEERDIDTIDLVEARDEEPADPFAAMLDRVARETAAPAARPRVAYDEPDTLGDDIVVEPAPPAARAPQPPALATSVMEQLHATADTARRSATAARVVEETPRFSADPRDLAALADPTTTPVFRRATRTVEVLERPENVLVRLGLPARLVPRGVGVREMQGALMESLSRLPVPPPLPDAPGVVVAVVGTGAQAVVLARELSAELRLDPDRVVLATESPLGEGIPAWLQVCDPATAEERRRSWRRREYPTVVACSLPAGREHLSWAREILDNLEPTCTWAIVDAGLKCEDVAYCAEALGGIDVLALTRLDQTVSPAAVLDLGIPVGRLEGRQATPVAWADVLLSRI